MTTHAHVDTQARTLMNVACGGRCVIELLSNEDNASFRMSHP
jgi:hypothetical protein